MVSEAAMRASKSGHASAGNCSYTRSNHSASQPASTSAGARSQARATPWRSRQAAMASSQSLRSSESIGAGAPDVRASSRSERRNGRALLGRERMRVQARGRFAKGLKRFAQAGYGAARGRRRIVQFVRQAGGDLAQRGHFFLLVLQLGEIADAVGEQCHQARAQHRNARQHLREAVGRQSGHARRRSRRGLVAGKCVMREYGSMPVTDGRAEDARGRFGVAGFHAQAHLASRAGSPCGRPGCLRG